jgi:hypothetical protein
MAKAAGKDVSIESTLKKCFILGAGCPAGAS